MQTNGRVVNTTLKVLEPCEAKVSRTVLRGERGCKPSDLLDHKTFGHNGEKP